jgi:hypothetical protein
MLRKPLFLIALILRLCPASEAKPLDQSQIDKLVQFGLDCAAKKTPVDDYPPTPGVNPPDHPSYTCANFIASALKRFKAKSTEDYGVFGSDPKLNYVWGTLVFKFTAGVNKPDFSKVKKGDVLQFRDVQVPWANKPFTQHTAIVVAQKSNGIIQVVEQNYANQKFVTLDTLDLSGITAGTLWVYRPEAK